MRQDCLDVDTVDKGLNFDQHKPGKLRKFFVRFLVVGLGQKA